MDRADRDPVEVEADALMDAVTGHVQQALRDYGIADETIANDPEIASSTKEALGTAIATALRTAQARGAEGMREAAATWHDHEAAEIQNALGAGAPDRGYGRALHDEHKVSAHAIRALPLADKQEKTPAINIVFDGPPGPVAGRFVEVETDDGKSIRVGEWIERPDGWWALRITSLRPDVQPLEWAGRSVRSPRGDLYEVHQMSEHVWLTTKNGAALDAWKTSEASAKAVAQADHERRALPLSDAPASPFGLIDCRECLGTGGPRGAMGDPSMGQCSWCGGGGQVYKRIPTPPAKDEQA